jgi:anti-anti-sigma factor
VSGPSTSTNNPQLPVIALEGELDPGAIVVFERHVGEALGAGEASVVLDLGAASAVATSSLSLLCVVLRRLCRRGADIAVSGADARVKWVLERCEIKGMTLDPSGDAAAASSATRRSHRREDRD